MLTGNAAALMGLAEIAERRPAATHLKLFLPALEPVAPGGLRSEATRKDDPAPNLDFHP